MNRSHKKGFITLVIIPLLILLPIAITVMSRSTISLSTELRESRLEALCQDILVSGLAWSRQNVEKLSGYEAKEEISLDVSNLGMEDGKFHITVMNVKEELIEIEVGIQYTRGSREIKRTRQHSIKRP